MASGRLGMSFSLEKIEREEEVFFFLFSPLSLHQEDFCCLLSVFSGDFHNRKSPEREEDALHSARLSDSFIVLFSLFREDKIKFAERKKRKCHNKNYSNSSQVFYQQLTNADISYILGTYISSNITLFASFSKFSVAK